MHRRNGLPGLMPAALVAVSLALAGCSDAEPPAESNAALPVAEVTAAGQTAPVGTSNQDAADDPAIWRNPDDPAASLIVATDKKAGLYVYGLDGKSRFLARDGRLNNVDLATLADGRVIVVASDRNDEKAAKLRIYRLDTAAATLVPLGAVDGGQGEAYGVCLWLAPGGLHAFSVLKDGTVGEYRLDPKGEGFEAVVLRTRKLASQAEGCVADPRDGTLYVGEEDVGIWRFADGESQGDLIARADGSQLTADVEGLALLPDGKDGGWLIASSQGDNTYAVYDLPTAKAAGRFRIVQDTFGATEETDGIALAGGDFGSDYPGGLFVAQDGENAPYAQDFKLVSWQAIREALAGR